VSDCEKRNDEGVLFYDTNNGWTLQGASLLICCLSFKKH